MADLLVPAQLILDAIPRATAALQSTTALTRDFWPQQEAMLDKMKRAAGWTIERRYSPLAVLTTTEADLIDPYIER